MKEERQMEGRIRRRKGGVKLRRKREKREKGGEG